MKKLLFNEIDRKIIAHYYKNPSHWNTPLIVSRFEIMKAKRDFCRDMTKMLRIDKIAEWIIKTKIMKKLLLIIGLILTSQILTSQMNYEFSTWVKNESAEYNKPVLGRVAQTRKQKLVPWKITAIAISSTALEAVGDALYDMGKGTNQDYMIAGKAFQSVSLGEHFLYIPAIRDSESSWLWVPVIEALWRIVIFDAVYNLTRGLPIGYVGNTSFWDKGMQSFSPPGGMRIFADCVIATFAITLTFDKF